MGVSNLAYDHVASAGMMDAIFHGFVTVITGLILLLRIINLLWIGWGRLTR